MNEKSAAGSPDARVDVRPGGRLAQSFQEVFTVATRVRAGRQPDTDPAIFREHVKRLLRQQAEDARGAGYAAEDVRLAVYAYIAFLDETILNYGRSRFPGWAGQPLQEEIFGTARAGQTFFEHLKQILSRPDSPPVADLVEVYLLCLLLGFRGRYGAGQGGELQAWISQAADKVRRVRGERGGLSPHGAPPADERAPELHDPWTRRLAWITAGVAGFAIALFLLYAFVLGGDVNEAAAAARSLAEAGRT